MTLWWGGDLISSFELWWMALSSSPEEPRSLGRTSPRSLCSLFWLFLSLETSTLGMNHHPLGRMAVNRPKSLSSWPSSPYSPATPNIHQPLYGCPDGPLRGRPCLNWKFSASEWEVPCRESQSLGLSPALSWVFSFSLSFRTAEPQSSRDYQLCKKDCVRSWGDEELVRRSLWDEVSGQSLKQDVVTEKGTVGQDFLYSLEKRGLWQELWLSSSWDLALSLMLYWAKLFWLQ